MAGPVLIAPLLGTPAVVLDWVVEVEGFLVTVEGLDSACFLALTTSESSFEGKIVFTSFFSSGMISWPCTLKIS